MRSTLALPGGHVTWMKRAAVIATLVYMVAVCIYLISHGGWPTPDFLIPPLIIIAILYGRGWSFVVDWLPFLAILMAYEAFRGVADDINSRVHYIQLVNADRWLTGGHVPTVDLQNAFFDPNTVAWYDYVATALHATHFAV